MFGMGTGGALQPSSPETFRREASLAPYSPHLQNCTAIELTRKHSLFQIFRLFPSRSPRPPLFPASSASFAFSLTAFLLRSSPRPISIAKLHASQRFHRRPIYLIVSEGSYLLFAVEILFSRGASRLDAFSVYPFRTSLPSRAIGMTTVAPEVRPSRSSRTRDSSHQNSCAHDG